MKLVSYFFKVHCLLWVYLSLIIYICNCYLFGKITRNLEWTEWKLTCLVSQPLDKLYQQSMDRSMQYTKFAPYFFFPQLRLAELFKHTFLDCKELCASLVNCVFLPVFFPPSQYQCNLITFSQTIFSPGKKFDSTVSQLRALATHRPISGHVAQGAFELYLPQIRKWVTLACLDISTKVPIETFYISS